MMKMMMMMMKMKFRLAMLICVMVTLISCTSTGEIMPQNSYDGFWAGTIKVMSYDDKVKIDGEEFALGVVIVNGKAYVLNDVDGLLTMIDDRMFSLKFNLSNAVVSSIQSGTDKDGRWVETWSILLTEKDEHTLVVSWVRQVNNIYLPSTTPGKLFTITAVGELSSVVKIDGKEI